MKSQKFILPIICSIVAIISGIASALFLYRKYTIGFFFLFIFVILLFIAAGKIAEIKRMQKEEALDAVSHSSFEKKAIIYEQLQPAFDAGMLREVYTSDYMSIFAFGEICYVGYPFRLIDGDAVGVRIPAKRLETMVKDNAYFYKLFQIVGSNSKKFQDAIFILKPQHLDYYKRYIAEIKARKVSDIDPELELKAKNLGKTEKIKRIKYNLSRYFRFFRTVCVICTFMGMNSFRMQGSLDAFSLTAFAIGLISFLVMFFSASETKTKTKEREQLGKQLDDTVRSWDFTPEKDKKTSAMLSKNKKTVKKYKIMAGLSVLFMLTGILLSCFGPKTTSYKEPETFDKFGKDDTYTSVDVVGWETIHITYGGDDSREHCCLFTDTNGEKVLVLIKAKDYQSSKLTALKKEGKDAEPVTLYGNTRTAEELIDKYPDAFLAFSKRDPSVLNKEQLFLHASLQPHKKTDFKYWLVSSVIGLCLLVFSLIKIRRKTVCPKEQILSIPTISDTTSKNEKKNIVYEKLQPYFDAGLLREVYTSNTMSIFAMGEIFYIGCPFVITNDEVMGLYIKPESMMNFVENNRLLYSAFRQAVNYIEDYDEKIYHLTPDNLESYKRYVASLKAEKVFALDPILEAKIKDML